MQLTFLSPTLLAACCGLILSAFAQSAMAQIADVPETELIERLKEDDVDRRRDAAYELVRRRSASAEIANAFANSVSDRDNQVRFQALLGLARMGATAEPAIEALIQQLDDRDDQIRYRAADALGKVGPAALPQLLDAWQGDSQRKKIAIAQAFSEIAADAGEAKSLLIDALDAEGELPRYAAEAVVRVSPNDETLAIKLAQHARPEVRAIGISALAAVAEPQEQTIVQLQTAAGDEQPKIRETALIALAKSRLPQEVKSTQIEAALIDEAVSVRAAALVAIRHAKLLDADFAARCSEKLAQAEGPVADGIVKAIGLIGPAARGTFPALLKAAEATQLDPQQLAETIASFGVDSVPDILSAIERNASLEPVLALALAQLGEPAVPALLAGLNRENELVRLAVTRAIGGIEPLNAELRQVLEERVADSSAAIRSVALQALLERTSDSPQLRELVERSSKDAAGMVRAAALAAVPRLEFTREQREQLVAVGLTDADMAVVSQGLATLGKLPKLFKGQQPRLVTLLQHDSGDIRRSALDALAELSPEDVDESLIGAVRLTLSDEQAAVRLAATRVVRELGLKQPEVIEQVANNLGDQLDLLRESLETIANFGPAAENLVPTIGHLLQHESSSVRNAAVKAMAAIDSNKPRKIACLTEVLHDKDWEVRQLAGSELAKLGPEAAPATPRLFELLSSDEDSDYASNALKEINAAPVEAVPMLIAKLDSGERRVGFYAITLLGKIGPPAAEALPKLEELLAKAREGDERSDFRRKQLRETIAAIKGDAGP